MDQARSQPSDNGWRGRFPQILDLFEGLKIGVPSGCLGETSIFRIMINDYDVTLWSKPRLSSSLRDNLDVINFIS